MAESDAGGPLRIIGIAVTALAALPITYYVTPLTPRPEITISNVWQYTWSLPAAPIG
jgi:hypothetical protein